MTLTIPQLSFVVLIGVSGSGKSTFARKHFKATEILFPGNIAADAARWRAQVIFSRWLSFPG